MGEGRARLPALTVVAVAVAGVAAVAQYAFPAIVPLFERDPAGWSSGRWWQAVTPLLVQTLGWYQVIANLVTLAVFGTIAEWAVGRLRWLLLVAAGTAGGQVAAYAWGEPGGGSSIAICGLAGGAGVALFAHPGRIRFAAPAVAGYVAALTGWGFGGPLGASVACLAAGVILVGAHLLDGLAGGRLHVERLGLATAAGCAVVLSLARDLHGISLVAGVTTMILLALSAGPAPRASVTLRSASR